MAYKRTTRKLPGGLKITTTIGRDNHVRQTYTQTSKVPGFSVTRSHSSTTRFGKGQRYTTTTNNNGWVSRTSKTIGKHTKPPKVKIPKTRRTTYRRRRRSRSGGKPSFGLFHVFILIILAIVVLTYT